MYVNQTPEPFRRVLLTLLVSFPALLAANPLPDKPHIYVQGRAAIEVEPDQLVIDVGLMEIGDEIESAKAEVDARSRLLIERAREIGIADRDIGTTALVFFPDYDYVDGERVDLGTRVYRQVTLTLRDLSKYSDLMRALVAADVSTSISTRFRVSTEDALADQMLARALANARERAEDLVASQGQRLGDVYSISEFDTRRDERSVLYPNSGVVGQSARLAGQASVSNLQLSEPFEPGMMIATATVYVVYLIR